MWIQALSMSLKQENPLANNTKHWPHFPCRCITSRKSHFKRDYKKCNLAGHVLPCQFRATLLIPLTRFPRWSIWRQTSNPRKLRFRLRPSFRVDQMLQKEQKVNIDDPSSQIIISRLLVLILSLIRFFLSYSSISFCRMDYFSHPGMCADWMVTAGQ